MKFSELDETSWPTLAPYLDTCIVPVSGIVGTETPDMMTSKVAAAGDWLLPLEQAFKGRTVTLPALHYYDGGPGDADKLNAICAACRRGGFRYVIVVCGTAGLLDSIQTADLVIAPTREDELPDAQQLRKKVTDMWRHGLSEDGSTEAGGKLDV